MKTQSVGLRQYIGNRKLNIAALFTVFVGLALFCTGCHRGSDEPLTQLQIREIQSRTFAARDAKAVIKEMINVLQDDAFIVKHANLELGLLSAEKDIDVENGWSRFFSVMASSRDASWKKNCLVEVSANVTQFGDETRVRVNFQRKLFDNFGRIMKVHPIYDMQYYQEFFSKVSKGLFIQEEKI